MKTIFLILLFELTSSYCFSAGKKSTESSAQRAAQNGICLETSSHYSEQKSYSCPVAVIRNAKAWKPLMNALKARIPSLLEVPASFTSFTLGKFTVDGDTGKSLKENKIQVQSVHPF